MRVTVADPEYIPYTAFEIDSLWSCNVAWMRLLLLPLSLVLASFEDASARAFYVSDFIFPDLSELLVLAGFESASARAFYVSDFIFPDLSELFSVFVQGPLNYLSCPL